MSDIKFDRRRLLAAAGIAPLALAADRALGQSAVGQPLLGNPALPEIKAKQMRWAVVGLGSFGVGQVIPGLLNSRQSRITAFVSGNPQKAADLGARYGVSKFYDYNNFDAIAKDKEIDCVYIVLPVALHAEYTIRALKAGKHVLCEKPMASTSAECEAMIAAARAANRQLGVAYRIHFEPNNVLAKNRIAAGDIGDLRFISCDHGFNADPVNWAPHKWRLEKALAGGGSMFDIGVYGLNTSLMMAGDDVTEVSAVYSYPREDPRFREVEGGINYRLTLRNGVNVQGSSSYCYSPYASRQRYFGSKASLSMEPATTYDNNRMVIEGGGPRREVSGGNPMMQFAAQVDAFSEAARTNTPHRTPGEMGLRDLRLIEAMYRSADAGGAVIRL